MFFRRFLNTPPGSSSSTPDPGSVASGGGRAKGFPDNPNEPAQISSPSVLLIIYNPAMDGTGKKLVRTMGWSRPDELVRGFIADILEVSGGMVRYRIAQRLELNEFPALIDGFRYAPQSYLDVIRGRASAHNPSGIDYAAILKQFDLLQRVGRGEFDEVWIMGFPYAGLYESVMAGPGAFWCNAPPLKNTDASTRRFVIMGFSYERELGEMLHSYNHRCESILAKVFNALDFLAWAYKPNRVPPTVGTETELNLFQRFILFQQIAPGMAAVGLVHYAPNSARDYDLGNPNPVRSDCYDWLSFPNFRGDVRMVAASEWGGGSERGFQQWWLKHMPKMAGRKNGIHNNWWQYVANPGSVPVS